MNYIVFDLEFNQDLSISKDTHRTPVNTPSLPESKNGLSQYPYEIIQIGAVKLNSDFTAVASFNRYIKPSIYSGISTFVTELTGITTESLRKEETFPAVYQSFLDFADGPASILTVWGMSDLKALYENVRYHQLKPDRIPSQYINIQPYVSLHFMLSEKKLLSLQTAVEMLGIRITYDFHNALYDAFYTAKIWKKIYQPTTFPKTYSPNHVTSQPRKPKKLIRYDKLIQQIEKMYARPMTQEEQAIIRLAYHMGKTNQFTE
jgi:DNA polymerase III epsilon subunit-like protein